MKIIPKDLSVITAENIRSLKDGLSAAPVSNRGHIKAVFSGLEKPQLLSVAMNYLHELQRLQWVVDANVVNSDTLTALETNKATWKNFQSMPLTYKQFRDLGKKLYDCRKDNTSSVALIVHDYSKHYGEQVLKNCVLNGNETGIHFNDDWAKSMILSQCTSEEQAQQFALGFRQPWEAFDRRITLKSDYSSFEKDDFVVQKELKNAFIRKSSEREKANKHKLYSLTGMACPQHAQLDGVRHPILAQYLYKTSMFNTDILKESHDAMEHLLDNGNNICIRNDHGTELYGSIAGMTVAVSLTLRNLPGTELYTAPVRDSVNGIFASKDQYVHQGKAMAGIKIEYKDGCAIKWQADKGQDVLTKLIETDEGSHYIGEFGFGTNICSPSFQSSLNIMGEKKPGMHIAMGKSYTDEEYDGKKVNLNNGNVSKIHKDLALSMIDANGEMIVDGKHLMKNGKYVLPGTEILNTQPFRIS